MHKFIIGIGTNIEAEKHIAMVMPMLQEKFQILKVATWLKTTPVGLKNQPDYTNGAVLIESELEPAILKSLLIEIEDNCGRTREGPKFGPRTMDLDILTWNHQIIDGEVYTRDFLKTSILELDESFNSLIHP